jgi:3-hydroxyacyl-[acyl-carrier-protein] dehydratase
MSKPLLSTLPHRPPFLFVDEVLEVEHNRIVTRTLADPKADFFRGHYPEHPVMPGVLLCECCFQAGALLIAHRKGGWNWSDGMPVLTRIGDARFKHLVRPGDSMVAEVMLDDELDGAYVLTGRLSVGGKLAVRVGFTCMLAATSDLNL